MITRRSLIGAALAAPAIIRPSRVLAASSMNQWDIVPTQVTQAEAMYWESVADWGGVGSRAGQHHSIAYVGKKNGQPMTCFSCSTRGFEPGTAAAAKVAFLALIDSYNGQSGWCRLTSIHYDASGSNPYWRDDWHVPFTPNPSSHPSAQGVFITDLWNQRIPSSPGTVNFSVDVMGSGRIYAARLMVAWPVL